MALINVDKQFENIKSAAVNAVTTIFPIEKKKHRIVLNKVWVDDKASDFDYATQEKVKEKNGSWGADVLADISLIDIKTGRVVDRESKVKLFLLPKLTDRASYIVKGNEYQVQNQLRLKSGAYSKQTKNGDVKTQFNLSKGKNSELNINSKGAFELKLDQAKIPLYSILVGMGMTDKSLRQVWGDKVYQQNFNEKVTPQTAIKRLASSLTGKKDLDFESSKDEIKAYIQNTEMNPAMTKLTLGTGYDKFTPELWLHASKKLADVNSGKAEPDDVDNLAFKEFFGVDDSIKERIEKNKGMLVNKITRNLDSRDKIKNIINLNTFSSTVESFFSEDDRSATSDQVNPLHMYAGHEKITFMGPGAIKEEHSITDETRNVHPTHYGFLDPVHTPESSRIGVNLGLSLTAKKDGTDIKAPFVNPKTKETTFLSPLDIFDKIVAFPDGWDHQKKKFTTDKVKAQIKGRVVTVDKKDVDYVISAPQNAFALSTNLIPFLASDNGNRSMMAGKHMEQAIPLKNREVPLVQTKTQPGSDLTFEEVMGESLIAKSPISGTVKKVAKDHIAIQSGKEVHKVNLYNNFTLNSKTFMNHEPTVKVGDKVTQGQMLADSNFTKNGVFALGTNLKAAYIPYKGYNFEDGIVITDSASKKLTSEHIHKVSQKITSKSIQSLPKFLLRYPNEVALANRDKLDESGVIKVGSDVSQGDVLIAHLVDTGVVKGLEDVKATFKKSAGSTLRGKSEVWNYEFPGKVTKVVRNADEVTVYVKTSEPAKIGDKLAGRHGNKGIITKILPDSQAPHDAEGNPVDIMLNPHGVISRINIGQMYESAVGKVADKTKSVYKVDNFSGENYLDSVNKHMKNNNISDLEELFDPETGKSLGKIHVGKPYILKLNKQSEVQFSVRGEGGPVSQTTKQPTTGGEEGAKAVDALTMYSMLSHGARANLKEMATYKSENNPELWEAIKYGQHLPAPKTPFVFDKFINMLKATGVDVKKDGSKMYLAPLTDDQIKKQSKLEIEDPLFVRASGDRRVEEKGGLLDPTHLGGATGENWGHIKLKEPIPNPIFEDAIKNLTDMNSSTYNQILNGEKTVNVGGKDYTGGRAFKALLDNIDVKKELSELKPQLSTLRGSKLNKVTKRYRYLHALKENNLTPSEAYIRTVLPVIPPKYRPVSVMDSGDLAVDDSNILYRDVALINKQMNLPVADLLDDKDLVDVRDDFNKRVRALTGLETIKVGVRDKSGFITTIKGSQPKLGFYQNKVLRKNQNLVGRGTIIPEPNLHMDEVALPELMAWKLYSPFAIKNLVQQGMTATQAQEEITNSTPAAKRALEVAMNERPVMLNRPPSLHKFSIMAFKPKITEGKAIKIPPLIVSGFNADFDGDTMTAHVPITDEAVREAYGMMPSQNLYKPGTGQLMVGPSQESQLGFYLMTTDAKGREELNKLLPAGYKITEAMDKKKSRAFFKKLSEELPSNQFSKLIDTLKKRGEQSAFERGFTLSLKDLSVLPGRDQFLNKVDKYVDAYASGKMTEAQLEDKILGNKGVKNLMQEHIKDSLKGTGNAFYEMVNSGARGEMGQLQQITATPLIVQDPRGGLVPTTIRKSFAEGLNFSDYWVSSYGARKGMMDRALSTEEPGVFNKELMSVTMDQVVTMEDCGTQDGVNMSVDSPEIMGRFVQGNQSGVTDETVIDGPALKKFIRAGRKQVFVRSPLKCRAPKGVCRHCYGVDEKGSVVKIGDNVGAKSSQAIGEPMTQMVMNAFHTGGTAGSGKRSGADIVDKILHMTPIKKGKATLSSVDGKVTQIDDTGIGSYNIYINGVRHVTQPGSSLKVKKGDAVSKGDPLTEGMIAPKEILQYKGLTHTQDYMTNELQKAYHDQGIPVDRKTFETVVRAVTNRTVVKNDPLHAPYLPGDVIPYTVAEDYNKTRKMTIPVEEAEGYFLSKSTHGLDKGLHLTGKEIKLLKGVGIKNLDVEREALVHEPFLKGINSIPQSQKDWMAHMGATRIQDAIIQGASQGWMSDVKGYHPIPAYAYGAEFGEGKEGRY